MELASGTKSPARWEDGVGVANGRFSLCLVAGPSSSTQKKAELSEVISGCHFIALHTGASPLEVQWNDFFFSFFFK